MSPSTMARMTRDHDDYDPRWDDDDDDGEAEYGEELRSYDGSADSLEESRLRLREATAEFAPTD